VPGIALSLALVWCGGRAATEGGDAKPVFDTVIVQRAEIVAEFRSYVVPLIVMAPIPLTIIGVLPGTRCSARCSSSTTRSSMASLWHSSSATSCRRCSRWW
jgi:hypothetical protein